VNEAFLDPTTRLYAICAAVLVIKMSLTGYATAVLRNVKGVFISPEDYAFRGKPPRPADEQIERIRRAHHNDLENILPFLVIGFLAAKSGAVGYSTAWWLFVPFTTARILHTLFYAFGVQPWRSILFGIGDLALLATTVLLLISVIR
jgi:uncharacterized MAPEG superfamily protein